MKTTVDIPDELFREAKAKAAMQGCKLKDLMADGLRAVVSGEVTPQVRRRRVKFPIIKGQGRMRPLTDDQIAGVEEREETEVYARFMRR